MTDREKAAAVLQAHAGDALDALVSVMRQRDALLEDLDRLRAASEQWETRLLHLTESIQRANRERDRAHAEALEAEARGLERAIDVLGRYHGSKYQLPAPMLQITVDLGKAIDELEQMAKVAREGR